MPAAIEFGRTARAQLAAFDQHAARLDRARAEDGLAGLRAPGADQACKAQDLAVAQREGGPDHRVRDQVPDLEGDGRIGRGATGIGLKGEFTPDHQRDELVMRHRCRLADARDAAILHDRDAVGDLENLGHAVRDVDDRDALGRKAPDDPEEVAAFVDGQGRGRLVEDEQLEIMREALGDLDHLLLAWGQQGHRCARVDVDLQIGQDPPRTLIHRGPPDDAQRVDRLAAGVDVLGDAERTHEAALLVDHGDSGVGGALLVEADDRGAVDLDGAAVRLIHARDQVHERRLAGAVLADQRVHLAAPDLERDVIDRTDAREGPDHVAHGQTRPL